jgi:hypothetical protein
MTIKEKVEQMNAKMQVLKVTEDLSILTVSLPEQLQQLKTYMSEKSKVDERLSLQVNYLPMHLLQDVYDQVIKLKNNVSEKTRKQEYLKEHLADWQKNIQKAVTSFYDRCYFHDKTLVNQQESE